MEILKKIGLGVVLITVIAFMLIKLVMPAIGLWIVLTPVIIAAIVALVGFCIGAFYEFLKVVYKKRDKNVHFENAF